jgi:hypothetical protein
MTRQKNATIFRIGTIIFILFALSISYTLMIFLISSEPLPPWQSPKFNPSVQYTIPLHPDTLRLSAGNSETKNPLFNTSGKNHGNYSIIGPFKEGNYSIILVDRGDEILESVSGNGGTWHYSLEPVCMNRTFFDEQSLGVPDTTAGIALYRLPVQLPENVSFQTMKNIDLYDVWVEREWNMGMSRNSIHTEGRFVGIYGQEIIQVIDKSYSVSSPWFDQYQNSPTEIGYGMSAGWISNDEIWSLRNFPLHVKYSTRSGIIVDMNYNTEFWIASDKWFSTALSRSAGQNS